MKLSDVVRGVEVKENKIGIPERLTDFCTKDFREGYNSLASAEVVVDREKVAEIIIKNDVPVECSYEHSVKKLAQAIATAIESGSIISLKEEE